ncbi:hypothetical protein OsJ_01117 [Oryza sativa Japonica Group]|nr:hypothetical protein OsJ_01117 [Oryza sativa Japonica Group]
MAGVLAGVSWPRPQLGSAPFGDQMDQPIGLPGVVQHPLLRTDGLADASPRLDDDERRAAMSLSTAGVAFSSSSSSFSPDAELLQDDETRASPGKAAGGVKLDPSPVVAGMAMQLDT